MAFDYDDTSPLPPTGRLDLYRYLTADNALEYIAIMDVFCATLLADLTTSDTRAQLGRRDLPVHLPVDLVQDRCRQLVQWGNLMRSVHDPRVPTIAEYVHAQTRYQLTPLGGRLHRQVREILRAVDGVREVARELLGHTVELLDRILARILAPGVVDAEALAADVTTVFSNQRLFTESTRDFYVYLGSVLTRYDLAGDEYAVFKHLLLEYVDLLGSDVARHAPVIVERLGRLLPVVEKVTAVLGTLPTLVNADGSAGERLPGRRREDWLELSAWYSGGGGQSGPSQLRGAAETALGQLITNARRMLASAGTGASRRADLLRLAGLLHGAEGGMAHRAFTAAFGCHAARHLGLGLAESVSRVAPAVSWWDCEPVEVPVALRERGSRAASGSTARVPRIEQETREQLAQAELEDAGRRAAGAELVQAGALNGAQLSWDAFLLLLRLFGDLLAVHQELEAAEVRDLDLGLVLHAVEGAEATTVVLDGGRAVFLCLVLSVRPVAAVGEAADGQTIADSGGRPEASGEGM
ncbi:DUF2397 domain-containing protein [Streptomyces sp. NPDC001549]|uniref:DUF2397 domain-containing protein n=1 Tax=Streptomyces sp. NPDC001549 TaxID=3364586 RepID=UPI0036B1F9E5